MASTKPLNWGAAIRIEPRDLQQYDIAWIAPDGAFYSLPDNPTHIDIAVQITGVMDDERAFDELMFHQHAVRVYVTGGYNNSYMEIGIGYSRPITVQQIQAIRQLNAAVKKRHGGPVSVIWTDWMKPPKGRKKDVMRKAGVSLDAFLEYEGVAAVNPPRKKKATADLGPRWENLAIKEFGLTDDPREAAFIFTSGEMLDFSEKRDGGPGGSRPLDHRAIERVMTGDVDPEPNAAGERTRKMRRFMDATGALRVQMDDSMVRVDRRAAPLTARQVSTIVRSWTELGRPSTVVIAWSDGEFIEEDTFSEMQIREMLTRDVPTHRNPTTNCSRCGISRYTHLGICGPCIAKMSDVEANALVKKLVAAGKTNAQADAKVAEIREAFGPNSVAFWNKRHAEGKPMRIEENPISLRTDAQYRAYGELVADAYLAAPLFDPAQAWRWELLATHIAKFFKRMQSGSNSVRVEFVDHQPYKTSKELREQVAKTRVLYVSREGNNHPVFSKEQNLQFRAVHDYLTHISRVQSFSIRGEIAAYNTHRLLAPVDARPAFFTEVVGQASVAILRRQYPPQKIALLPFDYERIGVEITKRPTLDNPLHVRNEWIAKIERAWGVQVEATFGSGSYGVAYDIGNHRAIKITKGPQEGCATNLIKKFQRNSLAGEHTPARVAYPEIYRCAELIGTGLKVPVYAIEREAGVPIEDTQFHSRYSKTIYDAFLAMEGAVDAVGRGIEDAAERRLEKATHLMPEASELANALLRMARIGFITGDLHEGNIGVREFTRPGWPSRGSLFVLDYGINVIDRDDAETHNVFRSIRMNPGEACVPPKWPTIDVSR